MAALLGILRNCHGLLVNHHFPQFSENRQAKMVSFFIALITCWSRFQAMSPWGLDSWILEGNSLWSQPRLQMVLLPYLSCLFLPVKPHPGLSLLSAQPGVLSMLEVSLPWTGDSDTAHSCENTTVAGCGGGDLLDLGNFSLGKWQNRD